MRKRRQIWLAAIIVTLLTVIASWLVQPTPDPIFRGRPESDWISALKYSDEEQVKQWREFGPEGVQVLIHGLEKARRPWDLRYRSFYRQVPGQLKKVFPAPKMDVTRLKRMVLVSLLSSLSPDAAAAAPIMEKELGDEDVSVRSVAINYFTHSEDENALLAKMSPTKRQQLLPLFLASVQHSYMGLRNNGMIALWYYPEEPQAAAAIVRLAFADADPRIRELAAKSLRKMKPEAIVAGGGIDTAIVAMHDPDEQIAIGAAKLLGKLVGSRLK